MDHSDQVPISRGGQIRNGRANEYGAHLATQNGFQEHVETHTRKPYKCRWDNCSRSFTANHNLKGHIRSVHTGERPYICEKCSSTFPRKHEKDVHDRDCHQNEKNHPCPHCQRPFGRTSARNRHVQDGACPVLKSKGVYSNVERVFELEKSSTAGESDMEGKNMAISRLGHDDLLRFEDNDNHAAASDTTCWPTEKQNSCNPMDADLDMAETWPDQSENNVSTELKASADEELDMDFGQLGAWCTTPNVDTQYPALAVDDCEAPYFKHEIERKFQYTPLHESGFTVHDHLPTPEGSENLSIIGCDRSSDSKRISLPGNVFEDTWWQNKDILADGHLALDFESAFRDLESYSAALSLDPS